VLDLDAAAKLLAEFDEPAAVIVKHNNPCGVAIAGTIREAYEKALACDPVSAFGGVIALNREVDSALAERLHSTFVEVLVAPGFAEGALDVLTRKEAVRILHNTEQRRPEEAERDMKRVRGGLLLQSPDRSDESRETMEVVSSAQPDEATWRDLLFAWTVCKHVRSNAIVFARDGATRGIGAGQMSRVDSVRIATAKATDAFAEERPLAGTALASDAFFPFPDGPVAAIEAGARAIIQPGGSKRDAEVIQAVDEREAIMVFTRRRHFRH
jgi:phosphoribosylaminoimidazolecarboxamide formyltransferase / IMP cyclohydrolase